MSGAPPPRSTAPRRLTRAVEAARASLAREGSTRSAGLLRIGLALLLWERFAGEWCLPALRSAEPWRWLLSLSFFVASALMLFGVGSRLTTAWSAVNACIFTYYLGHHLGQEAYTHHHVAALTTAVVLLSLTPSGGSYSLDRWWALHRAEAQGAPPPLERGSTWGIRLIALHVAAIYFWGAVSKCSEAYLSGERMEHYLMSLYLGSDYPRWPGFHTLMAASAWGSMLLEFALAFGLFVRRLRGPLLMLGLLFHAFIYWTLPVGVFSALMGLLYLAFFDPDDVHRALARLHGGWPTEGTVGPRPRSDDRPAQPR